MTTAQTYTLLAFIYAILAWLFYWFIARVPPTKVQTPDGCVRTGPSGKIPCFYPDCSCSFGTMVRGCGTRRDPMMMRQEQRPRSTDGTTAPLPDSAAYASSPIDADSPPVAVKFPADSKSPVIICKRVLVIKQCPDPMMWYANLIGKEVPYLGEWKSTREYRSREPAGYINIVKFDDATIIVKEVK